MVLSYCYRYTMVISVRDALASLRGIESDDIHGRQLISFLPHLLLSTSFSFLFLFYIQFIFYGFY